jgi:hypothetical protein
MGFSTPFVVYYFSVAEESICVGGFRLAQISEMRETFGRRESK